MKKIFCLSIFLIALSSLAQGPRVTGVGTVSVVPVLNTEAIAETVSNVVTGPFVGNLLNSVFLKNTNIYVSPTGDDSNSGSISSPVATITNAFRLLCNNGTVIVRGGTYINQRVSFSNAENINIMSYPGERPAFWYGNNIASNSWTALSNGIFTTTMSSTFSNSIVYLTNYWNAWSPSGKWIYLYQTNVSYGTQDFNTYAMPSLIGREGSTNRCEHTPLIHADSISYMTTNNSCWFAQGSTLYVRFAVSNVAGGLYMSSTNINDTIGYGGNDKTRIFISGLRSYFGWSGFDLTGCNYASLIGCLAVGSGRAGFHEDNSGAFTGIGAYSGTLMLQNCESALAIGHGMLVNNLSLNSPTYTQVYENGCYYHDGQREGSSVWGEVYRTAVNSICAFQGVGLVSGYGFIDDASSSIFTGCISVSNTIAGWQLGDAVSFRRTLQNLSSCRMIDDNVGVSVDDQNCVLLLNNCVFGSKTIPVNISAGVTTHYCRANGCIIMAGTVGVNGPIFNGANVTANQSRYVEDYFASGTQVPLIGNMIMLNGATPTFGGGHSIWIHGSGLTDSFVNSDGTATFGGAITSTGTNTWNTPTNVIRSSVVGQVQLNINGVIYGIDVKR